MAVTTDMDDGTIKKGKIIAASYLGDTMTNTGITPSTAGRVLGFVGAAGKIVLTHIVAKKANFKPKKNLGLLDKAFKSLAAKKTK